jgi:hypothetical protein
MARKLDHEPVSMMGPLQTRADAGEAACRRSASTYRNHGLRPASHDPTRYRCRTTGTETSAADPSHTNGPYRQQILEVDGDRHHGHAIRIKQLIRLVPIARRHQLTRPRNHQCRQIQLGAQHLRSQAVTVAPETARWPLTCGDFRFSSVNKASRARPLILNSEPIYYEKALNALEQLVGTDKLNEEIDLVWWHGYWRFVIDANLAAQAYWVMTPSGTTTDRKLMYSWLYGDVIHAKSPRSPAIRDLSIDQRYYAAAPGHRPHLRPCDLHPHHAHGADRGPADRGPRGAERGRGGHHH